MHRTQLLLHEDDYERLRELAFRARRSLADIIREAIRQYLARQEVRERCGSDQAR